MSDAGESCDPASEDGKCCTDIFLGYLIFKSQCRFSVKNVI